MAATGLRRWTVKRLSRRAVSPFLQNMITGTTAGTIGMTAATDFRFVLFPNIEDIPEGDSVTCSAAIHLWGAQSGVLRCVAADAINSVILFFFGVIKN